MTRRAFAALFIPALGTVVPETGTQFEVSGRFDYAGIESEGYYALGQHVALYLDPRHVPAMKAQADKLVGRQARITLEGA